MSKRVSDLPGVKAGNSIKIFNCCVSAKKKPRLTEFLETFFKL